MNQFAHIFINYLILSLFIPNTQNYILAIVLFSIILDIDHLPYYIHKFIISKFKKQKISLEDDIDKVRSSIQEPVGVLGFLLLLGALYLFGIQSLIMLIAAVCIFLHWFVDLLTVQTRPFAPFDKRIVYFFPRTFRQKVVQHLSVTSASLAWFLVVYF